MDRAKHLFLLLENSLQAGTPRPQPRVLSRPQHRQDEGVSTLKEHPHRPYPDLREKTGRDGQDSRTEEVSRCHPASRRHHRRRPSRHRQDVSGGGHGPAALREGKVSRIHPDPPRRRSRRGARLPARRSLREDHAVSAPLHDALHDMLPAEEIQKHTRARRHRDCPAGLHARAHAQ